MSSQDVIFESRMTHIRELKTALDRERRENAALRDELAALKSHFDMALLASADLSRGEKIEIWDGWNLILGSGSVAHDLDGLVELAQKSDRRVWIVMDGRDENVFSHGNVRVSYTGGSGEHRADRFVTDYVRMARYLGLAGQVSVRTCDKDFAAEVRRLGASLAD